MSDTTTPKDTTICILYARGDDVAGWTDDPAWALRWANQLDGRLYLSNVPKLEGVVDAPKDTREPEDWELAYAMYWMNILGRGVISTGDFLSVAYKGTRQFWLDRVGKEPLTAKRAWNSWQHCMEKSKQVPTPVGRHMWADDEGNVTAKSAAAAVANMILTAGGSAGTAFYCAHQIALDFEAREKQSKARTP